MVRLRAHRLLGAGAAALAAAASGGDLFAVLVLAAAGAALQDVIDGAGHGWTRGGLPRRLPTTHSVPGCLLVSLAFALFLTLVLGLPAGAAVPAMVAAGFSHLAADYPTEGGVYLVSKRIRPRRTVNYDSPLLNLAAEAAGILLLLAAFHMLGGF